MPFTPYAIKEFISEHAASITTCHATDLCAEFPNHVNWLTGLGLVIIFNNQPAPEYRQAALQFVRESEMAFVAYENGRKALLELIASKGTMWSPYFRALSYFEAAAAHLYKTYAWEKKLLNEDLYTKDDGSPLDKLNWVYNRSKHDVATDEQPIWITNEGLATQKLTISFAEIESLLRRQARSADILSQSQHSQGLGSALVTESGKMP